MRSSTRIGLAVGCALTVCPTAAKAELVTNGSMTGPVTIGSPPPFWNSLTVDGDTIGPGGFGLLAPGMPASSDGGTFLMILDNNGYIGNEMFDSVGQTITGFVIGETYKLSFEYANGGLDLTNYAGPGSIIASIASNDFSTGAIPFDGIGSQQWSTSQFSFVATSTTHDLVFTPVGATFGIGFAGAVDGVSIVPGPPGLSLLCLGIFARRRRRLR